MMASPAHPILVEGIQSAQKKEATLFANANLALSENPSTIARSPLDVQQNQDRWFLKVLVIRYVCSQPRLEHIDSLATGLVTDSSLENMKLQAATMEEPSTNNEIHSDTSRSLLEMQSFNDHQCWPLMAAVQSYLGIALENVEGGMWALKLEEHQMSPCETCKKLQPHRSLDGNFLGKAIGQKMTVSH